MKVIKAIYNFIVGDMVILIGVIIAVAILTLIKTIPAFNGASVLSGAILVVAVLIILLATLRREISSKH